LQPRGSASKKRCAPANRTVPTSLNAQNSLGGRLIFLDETGTTTAMTRRYAWADVGERAFGHAPNGH